MKNPIIEELKTLRDEIKVQAHLLSMDAKDQYEVAENKIEKLIKEFGEFNEEFWVKDKPQVAELIDEYQNIKSTFSNTTK